MIVNSGQQSKVLLYDFAKIVITS